MSDHPGDILTNATIELLTVAQKDKSDATRKNSKEISFFRFFLRLVYHRNPTTNGGLRALGNIGMVRVRQLTPKDYSNIYLLYHAFLLRT